MKLTIPLLSKYERERGGGGGGGGGGSAWTKGEGDGWIGDLGIPQPLPEDQNHQTRVA